MRNFHLLVYFFLLIVPGCSKDDNGNIVVAPAAPTNLTATVISSTQVNLSWTDNSTNETGFKVERKLQGGDFSQIGNTGGDIVTYSDPNLTPGTTYIYRVIASNSAGNSTVYSNEVTVTTSGGVVNLPNVTACNQIWSSQNISVSNYRNGDIIPQVTDAAVWQSLTTGAWCWYNNDSVNYSKYGKLYNWYAVNDARGLAPQGWHVPSNSEWNKIVKCIDPAADTACFGCYQSTTVGGPMKSSSGWLNNGNGTNSSGFGALPGGARRANGSFDFNAGYYGHWWSSSEQTTSTAWIRYLAGTNNTIFNDHVNKAIGYSVRVVRD
jgi:uncharacterized protein (TIGR02145 family)